MLKRTSTNKEEE